MEDVAGLGFLHAFEGIGQVGVVRRDESGLDFAAQFAEFRGVEAQFLRADRANPDEFEVSFNVVPEHGDLVDPVGAQQPAPAGDAEVVEEFVAAVQPRLLEYVLLDVFGVGVHGAEFVDGDDASVQAFATQPDERTEGGVHVVIRFADFADGKPGESIGSAVIDEFKTAGCQAPVHLGQRDDAVLPFCDVVVEPPGELPFGQQPLDDEMRRVERIAQGGRVAAVEPADELPVGLHTSGVGAAGDQGPVDRLEVLVEVADVVDLAAADDALEGVFGQPAGGFVGCAGEGGGLLF